ncbi:BF3164 family lipoprotein, partial [Parabacteroides distasonis]|uniref:BF3164 family lipoprotein n=1 Tax=Parabacteroides distasonis TaxID=823 RepID=UPI0039B5FFAF
KAPRHHNDNFESDKRFIETVAELRIYTLYSGKKLNQHTNTRMLDTMLSNDILVYDWSGKCICRLVTDIKLFNICVTNDDKELIALGWDDDYHLYSFDLSKVTFTW